MALAAYRHVLRSALIAFRGDHRVLSAARETARSNFEYQRGLSPSSDEAAQGIAHAEEVARLLRTNVVQGERVEEEEGGGKYRLRIHEDTERGDNETVKLAGKGRSEVTGQCCGSGR